MIDTFVNNPKSIKYHVKKHLECRSKELQNKIILDIPAGNGVTTEILLSIGARVEPFDLFPEYFKVKDVECKSADILDRIPVNNNYADMLICQEAIEHISDQLKAFKEFNRTLKIGGELIITTPGNSCLSAKISNLLFESENNKHMPPNEINDIWMSERSLRNEIYYGRIFLIGLQKLRTLGKLSGFNVKEIKYVRLSLASLLLFPFLYPIILTSSFVCYFRNVRKQKQIPSETKKAVYKEQLKININPKNLLNRQIFMVFEKNKNMEDVNFRFETIIKTFNSVM